jgi:protein SCO1
MQPAPADHGGRFGQRILVVLAVVVAALLVLGVLGRGLFAGPPEFHATAYLPPAPAAPFTLTDHTGGRTSLAGLRGMSVLLFFGYTRCPDVCPLTLSALRDALQAAGATEEDARILLVTLDPSHDTPEILAAYVRNFGPAVTGLTGGEEEIRALLGAYGIHAEGAHGESTSIGHTSAVFGIDSAGMIRVLLRPEAPREELRADVATLLEL